MRRSPWFRPPRLVLTLFLGITGVLSVTMGALAWRLVDLDGRLASQRVVERLDGAADAAAGTMLRDLSAIEDRLAALAATPRDRIDQAVNGLATDLGDDAVVAVSETSGATVLPSGRLLYYPNGLLPRRAAGAPVPEIVSGERLENQSGDLTAALAAYRALTDSARPEVRAAALVYAARVLVKMRRPDAALEAYAALARVAADVEGLPAGLVAAYGRCLVLRNEGRTDDLRREAAAFEARIDAGEWPLSLAEYDFYRRETSEWPGVPAQDHGRPGQAARERLSAGLDLAWRGRPAARSGSSPAHGREALWIEGTPLLFTWVESDGRVVALLAGPGAISRGLAAGAKGALDRQRARLFLADADGHRWPSDAFPAGARHVQRPASETRLPWTLVVAGADPGAAADEAATRRRLALAGVIALGIFVLAGSAFVIRAVRRETAVARLQTNFVSAVSHEFRTPLASMRQLSELLVDGRVPSESRRADYYRTLQRESERLHRLVEALLDFGRMESGAREYTFAPTDLNGLIADVVAEFSAGVVENGFTVETSYGDNIGSVAADREALGRALWNLLDNAVKYSPSCRTVWVATEGRDGQARVSVRDRGVGVAPDEQQAIFDKFRRGAGAAATRAKGTGLGLAMVRHIVAAHGGRVTVDSMAGDGSTFTIELPRRD